ncbi:hypothetical protein SAMN05660964_03812 [Thiothrix caldifontis]|uniref:Uncharacterized protein n=1 Tax=Thiothrix caldifontis TaxID=525918 RepID=A0A1H4GYG4_9GAMM|nr:hypothetical protein [Thiothrix caldifontis]SEB14594.1 hypothetical protein SAMN05660964_03812 [Thiothrix caldifontis]
METLNQIEKLLDTAKTVAALNDIIGVDKNTTVLLLKEYCTDNNLPELATMLERIEKTLPSRNTIEAEKIGDKLYYKISELAAMYNLDAPTLNSLLVKAGLQKQVSHSKYGKTFFRTAAGIDYSKRENRETYAILLWLEDVMKLLEVQQ